MDEYWSLRWYAQVREKPFRQTQPTNANIFESATHQERNIFNHQKRGPHERHCYYSLLDKLLVYWGTHMNLVKAFMPSPLDRK